MIGRQSNVQDGSVLSPSAMNGQTLPVMLGTGTTIGHCCVLNGCTISDYAFIGMGSVLMHGAYIGKHSMLGAGSLLNPGEKIGDGELWVGRPAKLVRKLTDWEIESIYESANNYTKLAADYLLDSDH